MHPHFNNEGGTFPSLSISISIDIAWLAHSAQSDSLEDKCLIFLRQVGVGAARRLRTRLGNSSSGCRLCWCRMLPVAALRICDSKQPFEFSGCLIAACEGVPTVPGLVWASDAGPPPDTEMRTRDPQF